jgi:acetylornithine deacetylase
VDAIMRLGRVLSRLEKLDQRLQAKPPHPLLHTGSLHASIVQGGHELSSYPDHVLLQIERRTLPTESETVVAGEVHAILDELAREDPSFRAVARLVFSRPAYELAAEHALPQQLTAAVAKVGMMPQVVGASFWTDAAVLGHAGTPSVLFGPGGAGLHSIEEYVNLRDVMTCRDALVELAETFCRA